MSVSFNRGMLLEGKKEKAVTWAWSQIKVPLSVDELGVMLPTLACGGFTFNEPWPVTQLCCVYKFLVWRSRLNTLPGLHVINQKLFTDWIHLIKWITLLMLTLCPWLRCLKLFIMYVSRFIYLPFHSTRVAGETESAFMVVEREQEGAEHTALGSFIVEH